MKISREARKTARELFQLSLVGDRLDNARVSQIADEVISEKPRSYFQILKEFTRLVRLQIARRHAVIESATKLDSDETAGIVKNLHARFGDDITTEFRVNPDLIGGVRIQFGSDVWDGTVRAKLEALQKQL